MRKKFSYLGEYWRLTYANDEAEVYRSSDKCKWLYVFKDDEERSVLLVENFAISGLNFY